MCFAPQRRALFRHLNFKKWSDIGVFCTFWLRNVLRATTACTFSSSQLPKVVRTWCVLYILTSKCASRHNGVHFFISHLARCLRTRRFSEPTFRPSGATNHWKNTVNRDVPTFSRICIFFLLIFSLLTLLTSAFQLSILSEVSLLNFLRSGITVNIPVLYTSLTSGHAMRNTRFSPRWSPERDEKNCGGARGGQHGSSSLVDVFSDGGWKGSRISGWFLNGFCLENLGDFLWVSISWITLADGFLVILAGLGQLWISYRYFFVVENCGDPLLVTHQNPSPIWAPRAGQRYQR